MGTHRDVLVVEDDREINELVGAYVQIAGFEYRSALDGASALAEARERQPSLIVLDLMLPDTDGFEVCRRLKQEKHTSAIPIVMLTALSDEEHHRKGRECGAADYLTKPFDPDVLMAAIKDNASGNGH
ncbi:MAG TPA: response regulator [Tepidisphaeraceae bacterium]|jgi:DNA-binding response OmpR family regulator|nr:response regulator [Tepidisphaeraceae bacterium]